MSMIGRMIGLNGSRSPNLSGTIWSLRSLLTLCIERAYIKVGVAAVDLGDRRAVVTSVDVQATILE